MPTLSDTAICLRRWDFSETSQTVSLLTRESGVLRGLAKGAKRERGPFSGGLDLLTRGQVVAIVKPSRELATITEWHLQETFRVLRVDLEANRAGLVMADLVHHLLTQQDPHPALFDAMVASLRGLADDVPLALLRFQWALLDETGYRPELDRDAASGVDLDASEETFVFDARAGGVTSGMPQRGAWRVRRTTINLLRRVAAGEILDDADRAGVDRANRLLAVYIREIAGREIPTLRWAFSDLPA